ncbi:MAG: tetratricopeptide repeat protein, partial [Gemmatimonadales bacterium]
EDVSRSIVDALHVELSPAEREKIADHGPAGSVEAYDLYLLGRHHMNRLTKEGLRTAAEHFQRAAELQPDFAKAHAGLADSYMLLTQGSGEPPLENFPKARAATQRALEIDPSLEEAHTSLGGIYLFFDWKWEEAEREFRQAIELNPNYGQAHHWLAVAFFAQGRHREALEAMTRALALDPLSPYVNLNAGWLHYGARDYDGALAHMLNVIATHADSPGVRGMLGQAYMAKGMFDEAIIELEKALELGQGQFIMPLLMLGYALARAGRTDDARKLLQHMEDMEHRQFVNPDYFAIVHIGLGEYEQALDRLEQATEARTDWPIWIPVDPMIDPIRTHPRFVALLERVGLSDLAALPAPDAALGSELQASARLTPEKSLAVLPLENLAGDPGQDYFVDGMTEALISTLAKTSGVRVIARTSAMEYKGTDKPPREISRELRVDTLVRGSVQRSSESVKISIRLVDGATERQLWDDSFEQSPENVAELQSEVAHAIMSAIGTTLTSAERRRLAPGRPVDPDAYDLYLKGRQSHFAWTEESLGKAISYFLEAIKRDPGWAPAHAALADSYLFRCFNGEMPSSELLPKARAAATRAVELDETLGDGHAQLATIHIIADYDWKRADVGFSRAIELSPQSYSARMWHGTYYQLALGRYEDALAVAKLCVEQDPLNPAASLDMAWVEVLSRKYDDAIGHLRAMLEVDPNIPQALWYLGVALAQKSAFQEAIAAHEKAVVVSQRALCFLAGLAHGYASAGRYDDARGVLAELDTAWDEAYAPPWFTAAAYVALHDHDTAMLWLERAYEVRDPWLPHLRVEPMFDAIRTDPRYQDLVRRMNFPPDPSARVEPATSLPPSMGAEPKSMVVLPFENLSPDPDNEYFADGLTEELIAELTKIAALRVISRTSAMRYKGTTKDLPTIAHDLNVQFVLEGSVRKAGDNLRITAQLIEATTDSHLWAERYSGTIEDIFAIQEQVSRAIAEALRVTLSPDEERWISERPTTSLEAYEYYLRGLDSISRGFLRSEYEQAQRMFEGAVERDPRFAQAYAALSRIHSGMHHIGYDRTEQRLRDARTAVDRALSLRSDLPEAHAALGMLHWARLEHAEAMTHLRTALQHQPNDPQLWRLMGLTRMWEGDWEQGLEYQHKAMWLDPRNPVHAVNVAGCYRWTRDYEKAKPYYERAVEIAPEWISSYVELAYLHLEWHGDTQAARSCLDRADDAGAVDGWLAPLLRVQLPLFEGDCARALRTLDAWNTDELDT